MRVPRDHNALAELERLAAQKARVAAPEGRYYGALRVPETTAPDPMAAMRASAAVPHPIIRSWPQQAGLVAQQRAANKWASQSNAILARQAALRAPAQNNRPLSQPEAIAIAAPEGTSMAIQPHHSDTIFGMADELEGAVGDAASGLANEASNAPPEAEAEAAQDLEADPQETAQLMEAAEAARAHEAAQALEHEQEHDHEYE